MRIAISLLKGCMVAAVVFAVAWIRIPRLPSGLGSVVRIFIGYGILITIVSFVIGFPLARIAEKYRLIRWWSSLGGAAVIGVLLAAIFTPYESDNPFAVTFSPWTRSNPGFADNVPLSPADFVGSVAFGAIVGAVLGIAFWYFYSRASRPVP
jgi:membrane associated rhomboid family serine protease